MIGLQLCIMVGCEYLGTLQRTNLTNFFRRKQFAINETIRKATIKKVGLSEMDKDKLKRIYGNVY